MSGIQLGNKDYNSLYNLRHAYRRAGVYTDTYAGNFNRFDNPSTFYFRIFFDFHKGLLDSIHDLGMADKPSLLSLWNRDTYVANSALNYLMLNNEWERADMLREFIHLLSNINTYSPWYFTSIEGLGEILNRTEFTTDTFAIPEIKSINIKCIPDAYDNRIGTLIDLYRAICYSYQLHKEVVPANLRWFDMYIYIFPANIRGIHTLHKYDSTDPNNTNAESIYPDENGFATYDHDVLNVDYMNGQVTHNGSQYLTSSKLICLNGCEIDLNASSSGYGELKNDEGFVQEYTIPIKVRTAMEQRYNEILMKRIGDFVVADMDLPNADNVYPKGNPGSIRPTPWSADASNNTTKVVSHDSRLVVDRLRGGMVDPVVINDDYKDYKKHHESKPLGASMYRDQYKPTLMDPWLNMGGQKAEQVARHVNQMINAGKSAMDSWVDVNKLNQSLVDGSSSLLDRIMWGNIFETNLQSITNGVSQALSSTSSNNVVNQITRSGWTYTDRSYPNNSDQLRQNQAQFSNGLNGNHNPQSDPPQGNLFE